MNKKNKVVLGVTLLVAIFVTLGYFFGPQLFNSTTVGEGENVATFVLTVDEDDVTTEEVSFESGETMFMLMEEHFDAKEADGFVYEVDGLANDQDEMLFWVYDLNGEMGMESALEYLVQDGDTVEWKYEAF